MRESFRAVLAVLITIGVAATGLVVNAEPAAAATSCQISITGLPKKVTIDSKHRRYWVKGWSKGCAGMDRSFCDVWADVTGPGKSRAEVDYIWTDFESSDHITLWTNGYKAGTYTVVDSLSTVVNDDYDDMRYTFVKKTFVAKYKTYTSLSAKRSGKKVTLSGRVKRYSPDYYGSINYMRPVSIQRYSGGKWRTVAKRWSYGGKFSYKYNTKKRYSYRAYIYETSTSMSSTSANRAV